MAGTWQMRLRPDGAVGLTPPDAFLEGGSSGGPVCTHVASPCRYEADGTTFSTNLELGKPSAVCNSLGTYSWRLSGDRLTLLPVADACDARRTLLATSAWTDLADPRLPEGVYRTGALSLAHLQGAGIAAGLDQAAVQAFWRLQGVSRDADLELRLEAGLWMLYVSADGEPNKLAWSGEYEVVDDVEVRLTEAAVAACGQATYHYRLDEDKLQLDRMARECGSADDLLRLTALHQSAPFVRQW